MTSRTLPLLLALAGCYVGDERFARRVMDADGDGGVGDRFGGPDCVDDDPSIADCDVDDDGFLATDVGGDDCDDDDAAVKPGTLWYPDDDGDGHGAPEGALEGCGPAPDGYADDDADCDDGDAEVHPGAIERCDDLDRNCDGDPTAVSDDAATKVWPDVDQDGYGDAYAFPTLVCTPGASESEVAGDCDDASDGVFPGADELPYDGVDQDCDPANEYDADGDGARSADHGGTDCDDANPDAHPGATETCDGTDEDCDGLVDGEDPDVPSALLATFYFDADADGVAGTTIARFCSGAAPDHWMLTGGDCDDARSSIKPGAPEWCNGLDDDCDKLADEGAIDAITAYVDDDGDGFGTGALTVCDPSAAGAVLRAGDCDDEDADTHPGATEICGDATRQDCTPFDPDDCDSDGFLAHATSAADCDDDPDAGGAAVNPDAEEACDGFDNDCDGLLDGADPDVSPSAYPDWYLDLDRDGFGSSTLVAAATCTPPSSAATNDDDCDDLLSDVFPGAPERCDGVDGDCDGLVDQDPNRFSTLYEDLDDDGFGGIYSELRCPSPGWVARGGDCDDQSPQANPGEDEACGNGIDDDCDGLFDGNDPDSSADRTWYADADGDGLGRPDFPVAACADPSTPDQPYLEDAGDCDDTNPLVGGPALWFADVDGDGYGGRSQVVYGCPPSQTRTTWTTEATDCDDADGLVHPGAVDGCDLRDNDCNGYIDDSPDFGDPKAVGWFFTDLDGDGFGAGDVHAACFQQPTDVTLDADCDDGDPTVAPGKAEVLDDGRDNDCDPYFTPDCLGWQWEDKDGDGRGDREALAFYACVDMGAPQPDDCDDTDPSLASAGSVYDLAPGDEAKLATILATVECSTIRLAPGTYQPAAPLTPVEGSHHLITSADLYDRAVLTPPAGDTALVNFPTTAAGDLTLVDVNVVATTSNSSGIFRAAGSFADRLVVSRVEIDGNSVARGFLLSGGLTRLWGVTLRNVGRTATDGGTIYATGSAQLTIEDLTVYGGVGGPTGTIVLLNGGYQYLRHVRMYDSGAIAFKGTPPSWQTNQIDDLQSWDGKSSAVVSQSTADLVLTGGLIVRPATSAVTVASTGGKLDVNNYTIASPGAQSISYQLSTGTASVTDSFVDRGFIGAFSCVTGATCSATRSWLDPASNPGTVTNAITTAPSYVAMHKNLRRTTPTAPTGPWLRDLHLRAGSSGRGTAPGGDDAGYYSAEDPWYADSDRDGLPDGWERTWNGGLGDAHDVDWDGDGLYSHDEYDLGTCPVVGDTDNDTVPDASDREPLNSMAQ